MAKCLSLNTHSWSEEDAETKLMHVVEQILLQEYDLICLQEVNQLRTAKQAVLDEYYIASPSNPIIRQDLYAKCLVEQLAKAGVRYYWTWVYNHIGYDIYNEGVAVLSREPMEVDELLVSQVDNEYDHHTRRVALVKTVIDQEQVTVANVHLSWWDQGFQWEWEQLESALSAVKTPLILMGDFNNPEYTAGYERILSSSLNLQDAFEVAKERSGRATILAEIDGWKGNQQALRIDYILTSKEFTVRQFKVVFDGLNGSIVSDHYGISCEVQFSRQTKFRKF